MYLHLTLKWVNMLFTVTKVVQWFVLVMNIYEGARLPSVYIFHNKHKILYNLVCPDSAVSCVDFTSYNVPFCSILGVSHFFLAVDSFTWDKWILLAAVLLDFFSKILEA